MLMLIMRMSMQMKTTMLMLMPAPSPPSFQKAAGAFDCPEDGQSDAAPGTHLASTNYCPGLVYDPVSDNKKVDAGPSALAVLLTL